MTERPIKITIEYRDRIVIIEGKEAKKWGEHTDALVMLAHIHNANPFDFDPIKNKIIKKNYEGNINQFQVC